MFASCGSWPPSFSSILRTTLWGGVSTVQQVVLERQMSVGGCMLTFNAGGPNTNILRNVVEELTSDKLQAPVQLPSVLPAKIWGTTSRSWGGPAVLVSHCTKGNV